jgi:hypothetical protein
MISYTYNKKEYFLVLDDSSTFGTKHENIYDVFEITDEVNIFKGKTTGFCKETAFKKWSENDET